MQGQDGQLALETVVSSCPDQDNDSAVSSRTLASEPWQELLARELQCRMCDSAHR